MGAGMVYMKYTPPWSSMLAHWTFDNTPNDTLGLHNGSLNGSPTYEAGKAGQALVLNGTSQDMQLAAVSDLAVGTWTVSAWVKLDNNASSRTNGIIGSRFGGDNTFDLKIMTSNGLLHSDIGNGSAWFTTTADQAYAFTAGTWYMVTMTVGEGRYDYYVNGGIVGAGGTLSGVPLLTASPRVIHIGNSSASEYFSGSLDEMYLFSRILRAGEISDLYNQILVSPPS
jgi:hypothetical protein